jgi:hypothetical protein
VAAVREAEQAAREDVRQFFRRWRYPMMPEANREARQVQITSDQPEMVEIVRLAREGDRDADAVARTVAGQVLVGIAEQSTPGAAALLEYAADIVAGKVPPRKPGRSQQPLRDQFIAMAVRAAIRPGVPATRSRETSHGTSACLLVAEEASRSGAAQLSESAVAEIWRKSPLSSLR